MRRLIGFILLFGLFLAFIMLNLENKSDISFGFKTFPNVPVYVTVFVSIGFGMLAALLIALYGNRKKRTSPYDEQSEKANKKQNKKNRDSYQTGRVQGQDGSYGID